MKQKKRTENRKYVSTHMVIAAAVDDSVAMEELKRN